MSLQKEELLQLLQDPEVKKVLQEISLEWQKPKIKEQKEESPCETATTHGEQEGEEVGETVESLREQLQQWKDKVLSKEKESILEKRRIQGKDFEISKLKRDFSHLEEKMENDLVSYERNIGKAEQENKGLLSLHQQQAQEISTLKQQAQEEIQSKQREISRLQVAYKDLERVSTDLQRDITSLNLDKSVLQGDLRNAQTLVKKYEEEQKSFLLYKNLSPSLKSSLKNVFHQETFENFVACCAQKETMESLWLFTKTRIFNGEMESVEALREIFRFSVLCHNGTSEIPVIHLIEGTMGTEFDSEYHLGTPDSSRAGQIEKSLFDGYAVGKDQKTKQKAVVMVK